MRRFVPLAKFVSALALALAVAGCGGEETVTPTPETVVGSVAEQTVPEGEAEAGKAVFADAGCGSCHTFAAAETSGTVGPDLDEVLKGKDELFIYNSIVNPDAQVAEGFQPGIMPKTYGEQLDDKQLGDHGSLVANDGIVDPELERVGANGLEHPPRHDHDADAGGAGRVNRGTGPLAEHERCLLYTSPSPRDRS